jgi:hypothetical protein
MTEKYNYGLGFKWELGVFFMFFFVQWGWKTCSKRPNSWTKKGYVTPLKKKEKGVKKFELKKNIHSTQFQLANWIEYCISISFSNEG